MRKLQSNVKLLFIAHSSISLTSVVYNLRGDNRKYDNNFFYWY